ncbi:hypothetical protein WJU16_01080 [Chitinophaga pollutisoli]|uniref:Uncharacterized protein n=1 Tax=Chitinophaga pollutisoli TaxID=3133966 RepID=A0ABZ2YPC9_9BACT
MLQKDRPSDPTPDPPSPGGGNATEYPAFMGIKFNSRDAQSKIIRWNPNLPEKDQIDSSVLADNIPDGVYGVMGVHGGSHLNIAYNNLYGVRYVNSRPVAAYWTGGGEQLLNEATGSPMVEETISSAYYNNDNGNFDLMLQVYGMNDRGVFKSYYYRISKSGEVTKHGMPDAFAHTSGAWTTYGGYNASGFKDGKAFGFKTLQYNDGIYTALGREGGTLKERFLRREGYNAFKINATHVNEDATGYILGNCVNIATGAVEWFTLYLPENMKEEDVRFVPVNLVHDPLQDDLYGATIADGRFYLPGNSRSGNAPYYYTVTLPSANINRLTADKHTLELPANAQYVRSRQIAKVGNTLYATGTNGSHACFWKDGKFHPLASGGAYSTMVTFVFTPYNNK